MQKNHTCKILAIGIIVLFIGVSVVSSAIDVNKNVDESREKPEFKPLNNDREIFSMIGGCTAASDFIVIRKGLIRHVEMFVTSGDSQTYLELRGYKYSANGLIKWYKAEPNWINAPNFIGRSVQLHPQYSGLRGIALGDIEWS